MITLLLVYAAGFVVAGVALSVLARRHGPVGPGSGSGRILALSAVWPLVAVGLLLSLALFAPIHLAARRRERGSQRAAGQE